MWNELSESVNNIASDELILNYNELKTEAVRNLIFIEDNMKQNKQSRGVKWAKSVNVSKTR